MSNSPECERAKMARACDRREEQRFHHSIEFTLLLPNPEASDENSKAFRRVRAWSKNISLGGICFCCLRELTGNKFLIEKEELGSRFAEIEITRSCKVDDDLWEYGATVVRFLSQTDLEKMPDGTLRLVDGPE